MRTATHTPTPWIVGKTDMHGIGYAVMQAKQSGPYRSLAVCELDDDPTYEANALFIVKVANCYDKTA